MRSVYTIAAILFFTLGNAYGQQQQADSIGTIRVKKKIRTTAVDTAVVKDDRVFVIADRMPSFPGTQTTMTFPRYIDANYRVPLEAFNKGISGTVYISFIVEKNGIINDVKVDRGVPDCAACDAEAVRVIKLMPPWKPGMQDGVPVRVKMSVPVKFRFNQ